MKNYENSIDRIGDRPGATVQRWLSRRLVSRFLVGEYPCRVLEVGTGVGRIAEQVLLLGHSYVGVEPTSSLRLAASSRLATIGHSDAVIDDQLPHLASVCDNDFSHAIALHVLEHARSSEEVAEWLGAIMRRVRKGGRILIVCPNYLDLKGHFFDVDWTHQWVSTTSRLACLGEELGLTVLEETDLRGTFSNPVLKFFLATLNRVFPTQFANVFFLRWFGLRNFGSGIKSAFLWRMSWVVFGKVA
jgi:SAM-dependent methyltransferase